MDNASFKADLGHMLSDDIFLQEHDVDKSLEYWQKSFFNVLNKHTPKKSKRVKREKQPRWFNKDINLNAIKMRDKTICK